MTVGDALDLMFEQKISALPVVEDERCIGIVTTTDLITLLRATDKLLQSEYPHYDDCLWAVDLIQRKLDKDPVREIMSERMLTTTPDSLIDQVAKIMTDQLVHHLVVEQDGKLQLETMAGNNQAPRDTLLEIGPNQALVTKQPVQLSGAIEERASNRDEAGNPPVQSVIAVPIFRGAEITGVISIHSKRASAFQESDRVVLETLAMQIETASERIRLFESVEQEQKRMDAVLNAMVS